MILPPWLRVTVFFAASALPFVPFGGVSFYDWMCAHWVDTIGGWTTGYISAYFLCWIAIMLPLAVLEGLTLPKLKQKADAGNEGGEEAPPPR